MRKLWWIFLLAGCLDSKQITTSAKSEADCDKDKAVKTMEQLKTEDYSLLKKNNDAGCTVGATFTPTPTP